MFYVLMIISIILVLDHISKRYLNKYYPNKEGRKKIKNINKDISKD